MHVMYMYELSHWVHCFYKKLDYLNPTSSALWYLVRWLKTASFKRLQYKEALFATIPVSMLAKPARGK